MDFGDCHRSLFLHKDAVTCVRFVPNTHYFFSCSKDHTVKYVDGDSHQQIMAFSDHFGEVWAFALSSIGDQVFTVSADKSIRIYRQGSQQLFPEEEKDKEADQLILEELDRVNASKEFAPPSKIDAEANQIESQKPTKARLESLRMGENLIDAINLADEIKSKIEQHQMQLQDFENGTTKVKPIKPEVEREFYGDQTIFDFVLCSLKGIPGADLESALKFLPYTYVERLLFYIEHFIRKNKEIELSIKCLFFLLREYEAQLVSSQNLAQIMYSLNLFARPHLRHFKDTAGFNLLAMKDLKKQQEAEIEAFY